MTGRPSSDTATAPARIISPISAISSPFSPLLMAAIGWTRAKPWRRASKRMCSVTERLSLTGSVLAMQATPVKPPAAAAMVPVRTVSLYSWPGSRRWMWMSISPGATTRPEASNVSASFGGLMRPSIFATWPSSTRRSKEPSRSWLGSMTRPPWIRSLGIRLLVPFVDAGEEVEDGHPHRDAVGDLLEDHGVGAVRQLARDLDAAVHRPRVHDDDVVLRQPDLLGVKPE